MDNRIIHDPHLEVVPDHAGPHYVALHNTLTQNDMNDISKTSIWLYLYITVLHCPRAGLALVGPRAGPVFLWPGPALMGSRAKVSDLARPDPTRGWPGPTLSGTCVMWFVKYCITVNFFKKFIVKFCTRNRDVVITLSMSRRPSHQETSQATTLMSLAIGV